MKQVILALFCTTHLCLQAAQVNAELKISSESKQDKIKNIAQLITEEIKKNNPDKLITVNLYINEAAKNDKQETISQKKFLIAPDTDMMLNFADVKCGAGATNFTLVNCLHCIGIVDYIQCKPGKTMENLKR